MRGRDPLRYRLLVPGLLTFFWLPWARAQSVPSQVMHYPDLVLLNGKVLTADDKFTIAEAIAIRDGKFLAVGQNSLIRPMIGPQTTVMDVQGKTVIPGIINTHLHLSDNAEKPINWWKDAAEVLAGLREQVAAVPEGQWMVRWYNSVVSPYVVGKLRRTELDRIAPKNPLVVGAHTGGYYALNSLAFQKLGVRLDAAGVQKDPQTGEPTGEIIDAAAREIGLQISWLDPIEGKIQRLREAIEDLLPLGTTTIHTRVNPDGITAIRELWMNQELKLRWRVAFTGLRGGESVFQAIGNLTGIGDDMFRLTGVASGATDSFVGSGGAWTFDRKLHLNPKNPADSPYGPEDSWKRSVETMAAAVKYGWSVIGIHSDGDRGTAEALAAYEQAKAHRIVPSKDQVLRLDHLSIVRPDEIVKMKELGVVPSVAAWHTFVPIKNLEYMYGPDRVSSFSRGRTFLDAGIKPAGEISSSCPFWSMQVKITRKVEGQVWGPYEKVSRQEALKMHTNYAAAYFKEADRLGTIEVGKLADLAVINGDYMTISEDQIETLTVSKTILGGKVVFETNNPQPCTSERYRMIQEITAFQ